MKLALAAALICTLLTGSLIAKGVTSKITLQDVVSGASVIVSDPAVLKLFNVWAGRGTFLNGVEGDRGFIIDWPAGIVKDRPKDLRRYEVKFFVSSINSSDDRLAYVVFYERDPSTGRGFVYLPGRSDEQYSLNVRSILRDHGLEGHWFNATAEWQDAVDGILPISRTIKRGTAQSNRFVNATPADTASIKTV